MKNIFYIVFLLLFFFLAGSNKPTDFICMLPDVSEWKLVNSDICLKVKGDSLFWTMTSDKPEVPSITASARYELFSSGKISLTYNLPLLLQDLPYIYGEESADWHQRIIRASSCRMKEDKLVLYFSEDDSVVFCRRK